jgi:hypothetical protein
MRFPALQPDSPEIRGPNGNRFLGLALCITLPVPFACVPGPIRKLVQDICEPSAVETDDKNPQAFADRPFDSFHGIRVGA